MDLTGQIKTCMDTVRWALLDGSKACTLGKPLPSPLLSPMNRTSLANAIAWTEWREREIRIPFWPQHSAGGGSFPGTDLLIIGSLVALDYIFIFS